jgi:hypothetical protein
MAKFSRRRTDDRAWTRRLPDRFSMADVMALVPIDEVPAALSWLYDAVKAGRVEPLHVGTERHYRFVGQRRADDVAPPPRADVPPAMSP